MDQLYVIFKFKVHNRVSGIYNIFLSYTLLNCVFEWI